MSIARAGLGSSRGEEQQVHVVLISGRQHHINVIDAGICIRIMLNE